MKEDSLYEILYQMDDTVIHVEEITPEEAYRKEVYELSIKNMKSFLDQVNEKLAKCENDDDKIFVKETTLNFLLFSLKKLIVDYDCPDENIEWLAYHLKDQILSLIREK